MIQVILGKKGFGKSSLSIQLALEAGGKIVFFSPVETFPIVDYMVWDKQDAIEIIPSLQPGQAVQVMSVDEECFNIISCLCHINKSYTMIIDEMEIYNKFKELPDLIHYSRHSEIDIIANTRRYTDMPRLITSQADRVYVFRTTEPRDIKYLKDFSCYRDDIPYLEKFKYYSFPDGEVLLTKVFQK